MSSDSSQTPDMSFVVDPLGYLRRQPRVRKWLTRAAWLAAALLILIILLPIAVTWYAEDWLRANGADNAVIEDIDINPFTGVVRVTGLEASAGADARLQLGLLEANVSWLPFARQRVHIQEVHLTDGRIDVRAGEQGTWHVGGLTLVPATAAGDAEAEGNNADTPWHLGSELVHLTDVVLTYRDPLIDSEVDINEIMLGRHFSWEGSLNTDLDVDLALDGARLRLSSDVQPWAEQRSIAGTLELDGLDLARYQVLLERLAGVHAPRGTIDIDLEMQATYGRDGALTLALAGPVQIDNAGFTMDGLSVANEMLRWEGDVSAQLPASTDGPLLTAEGTLSARNGQARHDEMGVVLGAFERLALNELIVEDVDRMSVAEIDLQALRLLGTSTADTPDVFTLESALAERIRYSAADGLSVDTIGLQQPRANVQRTAAGNLATIDDVLAATASPAAPEPTAPEQEAPKPDPLETAATTTGEADQNDAEQAQPPLPVRIGRVEMRGDAWLSFKDEAVTPPVSVALTTLVLILADVDSQGTDPATLKLETGNETLQVTADGTIDAFAEAPGAELAIKVTNLDLPPFSSYLPGYSIERGRFSTETTARIDGEILDVENTFLFERLRFADDAEEGVELEADGLAMPLDVALDLLRDSNDRIKLELPVSGSMSDPQFGTGNIIRKAMRSAVQSAAMSYAANALQPLGTILLAKDIVGKAARPRFTPVEMAPGEAAVTSDNREYLEKIRSLLSKRPKLELSLCGVAGPADRQALLAAKEAALDTEAVEAEAEALTVSEAELIALAEARTSAAITYLVETGGIDRARLFACRATFRDAESQLPRLKISL